jgi:hypothetical protein
MIMRTFEEEMSFYCTWEQIKILKAIPTYSQGGQFDLESVFRESRRKQRGVAGIL